MMRSAVFLIGAPLTTAILISHIIIIRAAPTILGIDTNDNIGMKDELPIICGNPWRTMKGVVIAIVAKTKNKIMSIYLRSHKNMLIV